MPTRPLSHAQRVGRTASDRSYDRTRRQADPRLAEAARIRSSARWQTVRRLAMQGNPLCVDPYGWHARECLVEVGTQVDHIIPLIEAFDLAFDADNLQALCFPCHARKTRQEQRLMHGETILVTGPPASGKTTYVALHKQVGDIVVDLDRFLGAILGRSWDGPRAWNPTIEALLPYAWAAYDGVVLRLANEGGLRQGTAWVIGTLADAEMRRRLCLRLHARCVVLACPLAACMAHIAQDPQRQGQPEMWRPLIADWWARYTPRAEDEVVPGTAMAGH